jgi:putative membrane protein
MHSPLEGDQLNLDLGISPDRSRTGHPEAVCFELREPRRYWRSKAGGPLPASRTAERLNMYLILQWLLSALALLIVARVVPGFNLQGLWPALIAAIVIGLLNATIGLFLKIVTFPLSMITLGIFLLVINALMIRLAAAIVKGFSVSGFGPAFWGAIVLALLNMLFRYLAKQA